MKISINQMKAYIFLPCTIAVTLFSISCSNSSLYKDYKDYGNGYEAAQKGETAPAFWSSNTEKEGYQAGLNDMRSNNKPLPVEFQFTEDELKSLEKKWSTFDEMVSDAARGNPDAMFAIGLCYLYGGKGLTIDVSAANRFFAKAASLGHAPSLEKIRGMYHEQLCIEDFEDLSTGLLHQVYLNLIITMGHTEYTSLYHNFRSELNKFEGRFGGTGNLLAKEVERIAKEKLEMIHENLDELEKSKKSQDSDAFFLQIKDITLIDRAYDLQYWKTIAGISEK